MGDTPRMGTTGRVTSSLLAGRQDELAVLDRLLDRVRSREAASAVVAGDAGIGKTRLVTEVARRAERLGGQVLLGGCLDLGEVRYPFGPFIEILRGLVRAHGVATVVELAGPHAHELGRLVPELALGPVPEATRASSSQLYLALQSLLEGLARRRPLILVVEDLHWADATTRDLVALLMRNVRGPVLSVVTVRTDEDAAGELDRFAATLDRLGATRIALGPLTRADQARQLASLLGVPPTVAVLDRVYARAEGNPFFAEELVAVGPHGDALPIGLRALLLHRVERLDATTRSLLRTAALAGRRVTHQLLAAAGDVTGEALDEALREAIGAAVLVALGDHELAFRHELLREVVASTVVPSEAARVHRRLAEALTREPGLAGEEAHAVAARVARHWDRAGDEERSLHASLVAGDAAAEALSFPAALEHYERALWILDRRPDGAPPIDRHRYRVAWQAAEVAHLSAFPERAAELVRTAISAVPEATGVSDLVYHHAYLHERLGRYLWMAADGAASLAAYERAVELVIAEGLACWQAAIYSGYGQILMLSSRFAESARWCQRAIDIASQLPNSRSTEGHARCTLGVDLAGLGDLEGGIAELRLARTIAEEEFDDVDDIARAIVNLQSILTDAGRLEEAAELALESIAVVRDLGLERRKGIWCRCDAADALVRLGRLDEADRVTREALELEPAGIDAVRAHDVRGRLHLARGELDHAWTHLSEARRRGVDVTDQQINGPLDTAIVECRTWQGDPTGALADAETAAGRLGHQPDPVHCVPLEAAAVAAAADVAALARTRGDTDGEREAVATAVRWHRRAAASVARDAGRRPEPRAHLHTAWADLQRANGGHDTGAWATAADAWEQHGQPLPAATARMRGIEAALHAGARAADVAPALQEVLAASERLGAAHLAAAVRDLARRAGVRTDDGNEGGGVERFGLTRREREVLQRVAEGRTDRQIGEELFISHRTAERHVANILAKLGAATRSEATAIAHRAQAVGTSP